MVESERRGVNFGGRGSYGINDCLVQREFEDEFREPCNENTANEPDAGPMFINASACQQIASDFNRMLNTLVFIRSSFFFFFSIRKEELGGFRGTLRETPKN